MRRFICTALAAVILLALPAPAWAFDLTDLKAHWRLNEASGTRVDAHGTNDLTDNNTVTQATGKIGDAAQFTSANSEWLSIADNADLSTGDIDFSFTAWVYLDTLGAQSPAGKGDSGQFEWKSIVADTAGDKLAEMLILSPSGSSLGQAKATTFGALSTATWYFFYGYHDAAANEVDISVNNGTIDTAATTGAPTDGTGGFAIGADRGAGADFWNGRIDSVSFWKRVLTSQEVTDLYNGGSGFDYPFTTAAAVRSFGVIIYSVFPLGGLW